MRKISPQISKALLQCFLILSALLKSQKIFLLLIFFNITYFFFFDSYSVSVLKILFNSLLDFIDATEKAAFSLKVMVLKVISFLNLAASKIYVHIWIYLCFILFGLSWAS